MCAYQILAAVAHAKGIPHLVLFRLHTGMNQDVRLALGPVRCVRKITDYCPILGCEQRRMCVRCSHANVSTRGVIFSPNVS